MTDVAAKVLPFHGVILGARPYILQLTPKRDSSPANISAVPLPGAVWLFGSAILAFLGFSQRRRI